MKQVKTWRNISKREMHHFIDLYFGAASDPNDVKSLWEVVQQSKRNPEQELSEEARRNVDTAAGWAAAALGRVICRNATPETFQTQLDEFRTMVEEAIQLSQLETLTTEQYSQYESLAWKLESGWSMDNPPFGPLLGILGDSRGSYDRFVMQGVVMGLGDFLREHQKDARVKEQYERVQGYIAAMTESEQNMTSFEVRVPEDTDAELYAKVLAAVLHTVNPKAEYADTQTLITAAKAEIPGVMDLLVKYPLRIINDKNALVNGFFQFHPYKYSLWYNYTPPENVGEVHRRYLEVQDMTIPNSSGLNASLFTRPFAALPTLYHEYQHYQGDMNEASVHLKTYFFAKKLYAAQDPSLAAFDGAFLALHQLLGRNPSVNLVYALNDTIESFYGSEMSTEDVDYHTKRFVEQLNDMIEGTNRRLTWYPDITWPQLTADEDAGNLFIMEGLLRRYYSRKNSLTREQFRRMLSAQKVTVVNAVPVVDRALTTEEALGAQEAYDQLLERGTLGSLEQEKGKGKTPVTWLKVRETKDGTLFLSEKALSVRRLHGEKKAVRWENSELREWLNTFFLQHLFSKAERSLLAPFPMRQGLLRKTRDRLFLLNLAEAEQMEEGRETADIDTLIQPPVLSPGYGSATAAKREPENNAWWLCTRGSEKKTNNAVVYYHGALDAQGYHQYDAKCGVRPAIFVRKPK